jgi:4-alpha-glucanotransferase
LAITTDSYAPRWDYHTTRGYTSLSEQEKEAFEAVRKKTDRKSEKLWEDRGRHLLTFMRYTTDMLVCAEDLGVVPACVPKVLEELDILGLNIIFWTRHYHREGEPFVSVATYPSKTVAMLSGHDTPTMRQWWDELSDRKTRAALCRALRLTAETADKKYTPETASAVVKRFLKTSSTLCIFQIQELFALTESYRCPNPTEERINVPGTWNERNWTYRLPLTLEELTDDEVFSNKIAELVGRRREMQKKPNIYS